MIARVTLDLTLRKEFDYVVPEAMEGLVRVGSRVKAPFASRQVLGTVTALLESSPHSNLRPLLAALKAESTVTPQVLRLARWMAEYYCCPLEAALRTVLPESVRKEKPGWKERLIVRRKAPPDKLPALTDRQSDVWKLMEEFVELPLQELSRMARTTATTIRKLEEKGLVSISREISERDPYANEAIVPTTALTLNSRQSEACAGIVEAVRARSDGAASGAVFLLHGVTGSGKTEVYLQSIASALERGEGAIVLVPEIALTPQTVERFKARFSNGPLQTLVAVLHSHLSTGERHDEWQKIRRGRARIVIGPRSAVFAPVHPLGLIIVDEEHEPSYKQEETPRYHGRDVAVMRGQMENAVVVLGSATPSLESYYNVQTAKYRLLELPDRADHKTLPVVRVVDMRHEGKGKGAPILSQRLRDAILKRLDEREQVMLFLNRRGYASSLQCPSCGHVVGCPNCSISLTYHRHAEELRCHICGHLEAAPKQCPEARCRNPAVRFAGVGTERIEETLRKAFPHAALARMDSDTLKRKEDYRRVLGEFRTGKIDILVGTQMIAKGLHFPNVTLVGIVFADLSLHLPDFRAAERTFQLLTQVAGRAGRGDIEGEVIVQSLSPFHPAIQHARRHDFIGFYEHEMEFRRELGYPPLSRAVMVTLRGRNEDKVRLTIQHFRNELEPRLAGLKDLVLSGPAPSPLLRAETFYRYQIMLRTRRINLLCRRLNEWIASIRLPEDLRLTVDVDPVNLM